MGQVATLWNRIRNPFRAPAALPAEAGQEAEPSVEPAKILAIFDEYKELGIVTRAGEGRVHDLAAVHDVFVKNAYDLSPGEFGYHDLVVDVGCNIGAFSLAVRKLGARRVLALEPDPDNLKVALYNLRDHRNEVEIRTEALWDVERRGPLKLKQVGGMPAASRLDHDGTVEVSHVTIDKLLEPYREVALLKLDCEGGEWDALLNGHGDTLRKCRRIAAELHTGLQMIGLSCTPAHAYRRLRRLGFDCMIEHCTPEVIHRYAKAEVERFGPHEQIEVRCGVVDCNVMLYAWRQ